MDRNYIYLLTNPHTNMSPSSRRAWIEINADWTQAIQAVESPSSRRAWIEIFTPKLRAKAEKVALLAEGVDRNTTPETSKPGRKVALLAEGVDRNVPCWNHS